MDSNQRKTLASIVIAVIFLFVFCFMLTACATSDTGHTQPAVQYEKDNTTNHTHDWQEAENVEETLVKTVPLQSFACEGIERVYLIRYRPNLYNTITDYYIACKEDFKDIEVAVRNYNVVIEYITDGIPRLEKYEDPQVFCSECGARLVHEGYTYKFCIPEGTYLVRFE